MAAQSLISAAIATAVVGVSAAGVATGTYLRNAGILVEQASPIVTGALADATGVTAAPVKRADDVAVAPSFTRIVIEPKGISRLEGFAAPGGEVVIRSEGREIAVAHAAEDGSWAVVLDQALPPGEHRLASTTDTGSRTLIGEDVRVFVPSNLEGPKVISYEAPVADPVRRRAESLAVNAGQGFEEVMARKAGETNGAAQQPSGTRVADASAEKKPEPAKSAAPAAAETPNAVVDWLDRSHKVFHDFVAQPLSAPPAASAGAGSKDVATKEGEALSLTDRIWNWFQGTGDVFHRDVVTPLKEGEMKVAAAPATDESGANAAKAAAEKAADEKAAAEKAAAEKAAQDRRHAEEEARRVAEEQTRARAVLEAAEAKAAAEAKSAEALKKAEEARRREAEETARAEEEIKRAAAAAEKRTAETERKLEDGLKRLDEAEKAQRDAAERKRGEREKRAATTVGKDGQDRNGSPEGERTKSVTVAEAAPTKPQPRNQPGEPIVTVVPRSSQATPADEAEDARKEQEEYGIIRRMIAEAKRLASGGEPAPAASKEDDTAETEPAAPTRVAEAVSETRDRDSADDAKPVARRSSKSDSCRGGHRGRRAGYHFVGPNDTLWAIARRHYGDGNRYMVIYRANRERIRNPDVLRPCQWIRIPGRG